MSRPIKPQLRLKAYRDYLQSRRTGTDAYYLRVHLQSTRIDTEEVASHVASRLNIEPAQALSVLQTAWKVMAEANAQGFVVNTPYFRSIPMARGTLKPEELTAPIDRDRISVYAAIEQGPLLHQAMNDTQLTLFSQPAPVGPLITFVGSPHCDADGQRRPLCAGQTCMVGGLNLKLRGTHPDVGITLTSADDGRTVFIPPTEVMPNEPKSIYFILPPEVTPGLWTLRVSTQYRSRNRLTQTPRTDEQPVQVLPEE